MKSSEKNRSIRPTLALQGMQAALSQTAVSGSTVMGVLSKYSDRLNTHWPGLARGAARPGRSSGPCVAARPGNHRTGRLEYLAWALNVTCANVSVLRNVISVLTSMDSPYRRTQT